MIKTMKIHSLLMLTATISFVFGWAIACQTVTSTKTDVTNRTQVTKSFDKIETIKTEKSSDGSLATPTEAYKTAFAARQKKDLQALKQVFSKKMLEFLTETGKSAQKSADEKLMQLLESPQAATAEVRNEKINGDLAVIEYLDEKGEWKSMDLVKEGDDWKMTLPEKPSSPIENTTNKQKQEKNQ